SIAEPLELAALALRRPARATVAPGEPHELLAGRARFSTVDVCLRGFGRADPLGEQVLDDEHPVEPRNPHAHLVADADCLCGLRPLAVDAHVPRAASCGREGPRLVD